MTNLTVTNTFAVDAANLTTSSFTFNPSLTTAAAAINAGTYTVGSAAQTFPGGLTVQRGGAMTMATSGGSVQIATGKTLTMDGTLNASSTGATIRSVSGTYAFTVGSTAGATPTLNITGLAVRNTDANGMRINANTARGDHVHALRQHRVHGGHDHGSSTSTRRRCTWPRAAARSASAMRRPRCRRTTSR